MAENSQSSNQAGAPDQARSAAGAMDLDFQRLMPVMPAVGQNRLMLKLGLASRRDKLHTENNRLGKYLEKCDGHQRSVVGKALIEASATLPPELKGASAGVAGPMVQTMRRQGVADLGRLLDVDQVAAIHAHLKNKPVLLSHDAHVAKDQVGSLADVPADANYACYDYLDLWSAPHILELASRPEILDLAEGYLGCPATLYSINSFWSFPNRTPHKASQVFHRDWEDYRSFVVFVLLTPVDVPEEGAHYYVEGSHEFERLRARLAEMKVGAEDTQSLLGRDEKTIAPAAMRLFEREARCVIGPAGTSFAADGFGFHRAAVPVSRPRQLLWFRFGNFYNETMYSMKLRSPDRAAAQQALARLPATPRHQYVFRYMIEKLASI
jgi:hypothetical protein